MKYGFRTPNLGKRVKARTTAQVTRNIKRATNPLYGKKGMGIVNNPKKAVYNSIYSRTTKSIYDSKDSSISNYQVTDSDISDSTPDLSPKRRSVARPICWIIVILLFIYSVLGGNLICRIIACVVCGYLLWFLFNV